MSWKLAEPDQLEGCWDSKLSIQGKPAKLQEQISKKRTRAYDRTLETPHRLLKLHIPFSVLRTNYVNSLFAKIELKKNTLPSAIREPKKETPAE
jgi:hypothetical protein